MRVNKQSIYILLAALAVAGYPVVASFTQLIDVNSTRISIFMRILIFAMSCLLLFSAATGRLGLIKSVIWAPLLIFWAFYFLRIFIDTILGNEVLSRPDLDYWIWSFGACFIPMAALLTPISEDFYRKALAISTVLLLFATILVAIKGSGNYVALDGTESETERLNIRGLNAISAGHLALSLILLSYWRLKFSDYSISAFTTSTCWVGLCAGMYVLITSASRGPIVAFLAIIVMYVFTRHKIRLGKAVIVCVTALVAITTAMRYGEVFNDFAVLDRLFNTFSADDMSSIGRQSAYAGALQQFFNNPFEGDFLEERTTNYYPHNIILESFMATGIFGGCAMTFVLLYALYCAIRILRSGEISGWTALLYIQYLIAAQFSGAIYTSTTMWAYFAIILSAFHAKRRLL